MAGGPLPENCCQLTVRGGPLPENVTGERYRRALQENGYLRTVFSCCNRTVTPIATICYQRISPNRATLADRYPNRLLASSRQSISFCSCADPVSRNLVVPVRLFIFSGCFFLQPSRYFLIPFDSQCNFDTLDLFIGRPALSLCNLHPFSLFFELQITKLLNKLNKAY